MWQRSRCSQALRYSAPTRVWKFNPITKQFRLCRACLSMDTIYPYSTIKYGAITSPGCSPEGRRLAARDHSFLIGGAIGASSSDNSCGGWTAALDGEHGIPNWLAAPCSRASYCCGANVRSTVSRNDARASRRVADRIENRRRSLPDYQSTNVDRSSSYESIVAIRQRMR
jgi:hypothetical protein